MLYEVAKPVVHAVLRVVYSPRIQGHSRIPERGAAILASNHLAGADTVFMPAQVHRTVHFLAKSDFFSGSSQTAKVLAALMRSLGIIPVDRSGGGSAGSALAAGLQVLRSGGMLGIYPEGSRSPDGRLHRGKTGMARLALSTGAVIVPIGMEGSGEAQRGRRIVPRRRPRIIVHVGEPIDPAEVVGDLGTALADPEQVRGLTDLVMRRIQQLSSQEYVDHYAADVKRSLAQGGPALPSVPLPDAGS